MNIDDFYPTLRGVTLFKGITQSELNSMLDCLQTLIRQYQKGEVVLTEGTKPQHIGIVLSGFVHIYKDDAAGNRILVETLDKQGIFNEALCCAGVEESPVRVEAGSECTIMLLRFDPVLHSCPNICQYHQRLIQNMLRTVAQSSLLLQKRMDLIQARTIRAKVLGYLSSYCKGKGEISVPHNREQMAAYLCVERSALSHELIRMKSDGLIDYNKNKFILYP